MINRRQKRLQKLADIGSAFESVIEHLKDYGSDLIKRFEGNDIDEESAPPEQPSPANQMQFNVVDAVEYNTSNEHYFTKYESDIKNILGVVADWKSKEFANAVYNWQQKNGFSGNWIDGKFGPITMKKFVKQYPAKFQSYDLYEALKIKHINDKPYPRVMNLMQSIDRIRNEMGATNIPLNMLLGWIQVESGGMINNLTTSAGFNETGLFQISEGEAKSIGVDQNRTLHDQDYAIKTGIELARYHAAKIDGILTKYPSMQSIFSKDSDLYWRLVFFSFSAGQGTTAQLISNMVNSGEKFNSWDDIMKYVAANPYGYKHSPVKWAYHVNRAFNLGYQIAGQPKPVPEPYRMVANVKILQRIKNAKKNARMLVIEKEIF